MKAPLAVLRHCIQGSIYPVIATCSADGTPNIAFLAYLTFLDDEHIALSFRFLGKTARNIAENPRVTVMLTDARTGRQHTLDIEYERTETSGPSYDQMRVRMDALAAISGMSGVLKPPGVQIYRIVGYRAADCGYVAEPVEPLTSATAVRLLSAEIGACEDLSTLCDVTLKGLAEHLQYEHSMILMTDSSGTRLYAVASHGYPQSGVGAEVAFGQDVIGVAAAERHPVRIAHMGRERLTNRWLRQRMAETGAGDERTIALVGLPNAESKLAIPILARARVLGVLCLESAVSSRYSEEDEKTLLLIAGQLGTAILLCNQVAANPEPAARSSTSTSELSGRLLVVRRFEADQSIFVDDEYLIKGVAGAILWKILNTFVQEGRIDFTNRELRLDPSIGLPEVGDNLEARLVLLLRRLQDRCEWIRLDKVARGRVRLSVARPLELRSVGRN